MAAIKYDNDKYKSWLPLEWVVGSMSGNENKLKPPIVWVNGKTDPSQLVFIPPSAHLIYLLWSLNMLDQSKYSFWLYPFYLSETINIGFAASKVQPMQFVWEFLALG